MDDAKSVASMSSSLNFLNHHYSSFQMSRKLYTGKLFYRKLWLKEAPWGSFLIPNSFKHAYPCILWKLWQAVSGQFLRFPEGIFCPSGKYLTIFNSTNLFSNHTFLDPKILTAFLTKLQVFRIFLLCFFAPDSYCIWLKASSNTPICGS